MLASLQVKQAQHRSLADEHGAGDPPQRQVHMYSEYVVPSRAGIRIWEVGEGSMYAADNAAQAWNVAIELMREEFLSAPHGRARTDRKS